MAEVSTSARPKNEIIKAISEIQDVQHTGQGVRKEKEKDKKRDQKKKRDKHVGKRSGESPINQPKQVPQQPLTPTSKLNRYHNDLSKLIDELQDSSEHRLVYEALQVMHNEQLCSKKVQEQLKDILDSAVQSSMLAIDLARVEVNRAKEKRQRNNEGLQKISQIYLSRF